MKVEQVKIAGNYHWIVGRSTLLTLPQLKYHLEREWRENEPHNTTAAGKWMIVASEGTSIIITDILRLMSMAHFTFFTHFSFFISISALDCINVRETFDRHAICIIVSMSWAFSTISIRLNSNNERRLFNIECIHLKTQSNFFVRIAIEIEPTRVCEWTTTLPVLTLIVRVDTWID